MRRKPKPLPGGTFPDWLLQFKPDDWPGITTWQQWEHYSEAVEDWQDEHPDLELPEWQGDIPWNPAVDPP